MGQSAMEITEAQAWDIIPPTARQKADPTNHWQVLTTPRHQTVICKTRVGSVLGSSSHSFYELFTRSPNSSVDMSADKGKPFSYCDTHLLPCQPSAMAIDGPWSTNYTLSILPDSRMPIGLP
jgi:hypothetical protein